MDKFLININGELANEENAKVSVFDRGFLYGDSVYEATRTFNRLPFQLDLHLDRLFWSAHKIDFSPTLTKEEIKGFIFQTIQASPHENISLRIILTRGTNTDLGLDPGLAIKNNIIIISKAIPDNPDWWLTKGLKIIFYRKKNSEKGALAKTGNYQENIMALQVALAKGAHDALMVNSEDHVTEGTNSNAWLIKDGILYTPPLSDGLLDGLTRQAIIKMAKRNNVSLIEKSLSTKDFLDASECFITSTTRNLVPVTSIEGLPVGDGLPGKMTLQLLEMYKNFVTLE